MYHDPFFLTPDVLDSLFAAPTVHQRRRRAGGGDGTFSIHSEVVDTDSEFALLLEIPGVPKEKIDLTIENNELTVKFNREKCPNTPEHSILTSDIAYGLHIRRFKLPNTVNHDSASTSFNNGVLCIKFNKVTTVGAPKKLSIQG